MFGFRAARNIGTWGCKAPFSTNPYISFKPRHLPLHANFQHVETKRQPNRSVSSGLTFPHISLLIRALSAGAQNRCKAALCVKARNGKSKTVNKIRLYDAHA